MTDIITVALEDTHARPNARPLDEELVGQIAESIGLIGFMPSKAIDVRRDGDIYWIVDGGHRVAAARKAGLTEIPAVIEDLDDAGVFVVEGASNLQRPDTEAEKWLRAQQMLMLGDSATPQQIAVATGIGADAQVAVRRVLKRLNDPVAAEDLTLEQALAADEFADDDEAFAKIMNAGSNWKYVHGSLARQRKVAIESAACRQRIIDAGCEYIADCLDRTKYAYLGNGDEPPEGAKYGAVQTCYTGAWVTWYGDPVAETHDPELEAQRVAADTARKEMELSAERRIQFMAAKLAEDLGQSGLELFALECWSNGTVASVSSINEGFGDFAGFMPRFTASVLSKVEASAHTAMTGRDWYDVEAKANAVALYKVLKAMSYEPSDAENAKLDEIVDMLAAQGEPDPCDTCDAEECDGCEHSEEGEL